MELTNVDSAKGFDEMIESDEEKNFSEVTMQELDQKIRQLKDYRDELERLEMQAGPIKERKANLENWLISCFREHNRKSYKSAYGMIIVSTKYSVTVPKGDDREAFREYLEGKGAFNDMWTVNSQKLNAWHRKEMEAAEQAGEIEFNVPGVGAPVERHVLSMRKR